MQLKPHVLIIIIVALAVYVLTRELTLYQMRNSAAEAGLQNGAEASGSARSPRGKQSEKGPDPYEKDQVKNTLLKSAKDLQECYFSYLEQNPTNRSASAKLDWQIQGDGRVSEVGVVFTDAEALAVCVSKKLQTVKFPPPPEGRPFYVAHSFQFKPTEQLEKEEAERKAMEKRLEPSKRR